MHVGWLEDSTVAFVAGTQSSHKRMSLLAGARGLAGRRHSRLCIPGHSKQAGRAAGRQDLQPQYRLPPGALSRRQGPPR